ncbi:cell division protein ZipA-like [Leguminivora glycinivorella]|uniref:cell division protein ZipA-like n=1 Tax=Leguminivora glycinivorella TaxID=1035111 RepID=UPI00200F067D|nr:cell division protein ZipA-like [Leguminivora glycinivorella]
MALKPVKSKPKHASSLMTHNITPTSACDDTTANGRPTKQDPRPRTRKAQPRQAQPFETQPREEQPHHRGWNEKQQAPQQVTFAPQPVADAAQFVTCTPEPRASAPQPQPLAPQSHALATQPQPLAVAPAPSQSAEVL